MLGLKFDQYSHKKMEKLIKKAIREKFRAPDVKDHGNWDNRPENSNQRAQQDLTDMQNLAGAGSGSEEDEEDLKERENLSLYDPNNQRSKMRTENIGLDECRV